MTDGAASSEKRSLAEEFLDQAIAALRDAGSPETLYPADARRSANDVARAAGRATAISRRTKHARTSMLFSAFAAEAFVNQFLFDTLDSSADLSAIDRLPTVEKYVLGTRLAIGKSIFDRGSEPTQTIAALFKVRDSLVHSRPVARTPRTSVFEDPPEYRTTNPSEAARAIVAVAKAAAILNDNSSRQRLSFHVASVVAAERTYVEFGRQAFEKLPEPDAVEATDLAIYALEQVTGRKLRRRAPGESQ